MTDRVLLKAKWFNQPYLKKGLLVGQEVVLSGSIKNTAEAAPEMDSPEYETVTEGPDSFIHTKRVVPVYRTTEGISQKQLRKTMYSVVNEYAAALCDTVPAFIIEKNGLPPLSRSIRQLHFPEGDILPDEFNRGTSIYPPAACIR